jgi:hypothetical protein
MSNAPLLKVDNTHVQDKLKEVLTRIDAALPCVGDRKFLTRTSPNGCEERILFGDFISPGLVLERFEDGKITVGKQSSVEFQFYVHNEHNDDETCCSHNQSIARAEEEIITVHPLENGRWESVTETTTISLSRMSSSGGWSNNALSAHQKHNVVTERYYDNGNSSSGTPTSNDDLLVTLDQLDVILTEFVNLALTNPSA